ncbi:SUMO1 sentrin specific peptidase 8 [Cichlidogyrus casuarinus]|uniref:SUMO1 sentrin specific peptidase 8 n=1 Tax=Cichlidogyrus casuarinus TaxID=1844966 RepID=A0ABD2QFV9_9PLAT
MNYHLSSWPTLPYWSNSHYFCRAYSQNDKHRFEDFSCILRECDLVTVNPGEWINDNVISFMYEHLTHCFLGTAKERILLMEPCVVQLAVSSDPSVIFDPLHVRQREWIFLPVNDVNASPAPCSSSGSHWALVVFSPSRHEAFYIDSSGFSNLNSAKMVCDALCRYCNLYLELQPLQCLQQDNGYDCGIYCLVFTERILECILQNTNSWKTGQALTDLTLKFRIRSKREELRALISEYLHYIVERRNRKKLS